MKLGWSRLAKFTEIWIEMMTRKFNLLKGVKVPLVPCYRGLSFTEGVT